MYLTELELKNVLVHKHFKCNFSPGINVITGENDGGKTTLFRAIRVLSECIPSNPEKKWLPVGLKKADQLIRIKTDEYEILRHNRKMFLKDLDGNILFQTQGALGKDIPPPIKEVFNLKNVNWQFSRKPHYILLENGSTVTKHFDKITGSNDYELLMKTLKSELSISKGDLRSLEIRKEETENKIKELEQLNIEQLIKKTKRGIEYQESIGELEVTLEEINLSIENLTELEKEISLNDLIKLEKKITTIDNISSKIKNREESLEDMENKIEILKKETKDETKIKKSILLTNNLTDVINQIQEDERTIQDLKIYIDHLQELDRILRIKMEIPKMEKLIKQKMKELGVCPWCNQKIQ